MPQIPNDVIAIGASAGGIEAIKIVLAELPRDLEAVVLIALHRDPERSSRLRDILNRVTNLSVVEAAEGENLSCATCYLNPSTDQLLVDGQQAKLAKYQNRADAFRCIDDLMKSVSIYARERSIGVVLSGLNGDGAEGLRAIKARGGITVVQHPADAIFSHMPNVALEKVRVDFIGDAAAIGRFLRERAELRKCELPVDDNHAAN